MLSSCPPPPTHTHHWSSSRSDFSFHFVLNASLRFGACEHWRKLRILSQSADSRCWPAPSLFLGLCDWKMHHLLRWLLSVTFVNINSTACWSTATEPFSLRLHSASRGKLTDLTDPDTKFFSKLFWSFRRKPGGWLGEDGQRLDESSRHQLKHASVRECFLC